MSDTSSPPPEAAASAFTHYIGQLIHWGAAEWRHVMHGGPDPGPVPLPGGNVPAPPPPPPGPPSPPPSSGTMYWVIDKSAAKLVSAAQLAAFVLAENDDVARLQAQWPHVQEWAHVSGRTPPAGAIVATLVAELPEAPGALAYHDVSATGVPYQRVGVKTCTDNGVSWQSAADHETKELTVDPMCTVVVTDPATGYTYAYEIADPVESDSYQVDGQDMSNSVGPTWFGATEVGAAPGFDLLGNVHKAFTMDPGGYVIVDKHDGKGPQPVFGERFPEFRRRHVEALGRRGTPRRPL